MLVIFQVSNSQVLVVILTITLLLFFRLLLLELDLKQIGLDVGQDAALGDGDTESEDKSMVDSLGFTKTGTSKTLKIREKYGGTR